MKKLVSFGLLAFFIAGISIFVVTQLLPTAQMAQVGSRNINPIDEIMHKLHTCTKANMRQRQEKCGDLSASLVETMKRSSADFDHFTDHFFDVYLKGDYVVYLRPLCKDDDVEPDLFFLNYWPQNVAILPDARKKIGFQSLDFYFSKSGFRSGRACIVLKKIEGSGGPVNMATGQYVRGKGPTWKMVYP